MAFGNVGASTAPSMSYRSGGWATPSTTADDDGGVWAPRPDGHRSQGPWVPTGGTEPVPYPDYPDTPTYPAPAPVPTPTPRPSTPPSTPSTPPADDAPDAPTEPPVQRNRTLATLDSMKRSSGAAFADSAYFTGLFERSDAANGVNGAVKPDWSTIGLAGGTVAGLGSLYRIATNLDSITNAHQMGSQALTGAARAVGGLGKLAIFASPVIAAGVAAPALADLAHLAMPGLVKQHQEVPDGISQSERNRLNNNNDQAWLSRAAAGALSVGVLTGAALLVHNKPLPGPAILERLFGGGMAGAARGAAALGLVGGVSAGAFYNVFDKNGDITRTHSPLRSY